LILKYEIMRHIVLVLTPVKSLTNPSWGA